MLIHQYTEFDVIGCHWIANSPPPPKKGGGGGGGKEEIMTIALV